MTEAFNIEQWVEQYAPRKYPRTRELWKAIYQEFLEQQPPMTVRQMFYRMSSTFSVSKTENGYKQVLRELSAMRRAGAIPYSWIADNTRWVRKPRTYSSLQRAALDWHRNYRRSLWAEQPVHIEIWLEKDALAGVLNEITGEFDVPLYVTRGYASLSYLYEAAEALKSMGKPSVIYHFGDFDASGRDAARAVQTGLRELGAVFEFVPVAVTEEQITAYNLQTRPSKKSDPRAARHGALSVELDAIPPAQLRQLIRQTIEGQIDPHALQMVREIEKQEKATILNLARQMQNY